MGLGSIVSGLIANGNSLPTVNIRPLLDTINNAGTYQRQIINDMPSAVRKQLMEYAASMGEGGAQYQGAIQALSQGLQDKAGQIYGPNSEAAKAAMLASKKEIYSTLPGTQNAIRNALAATGGLSRGNAGAALAQPYMQAAQQYGQAATNIAADQASKGQAIQQQALMTATQMDAAMFQNMFGMSKEQATQILTSGNAALSEQLAALIAQSNNQTNQTLSAQGIAVNNGYQNAVTRNAQQNAIWSGLSNMAIDGAMNLAMPGAGSAPIPGMEASMLG